MFSNSFSEGCNGTGCHVPGAQTTSTAAPLTDSSASSSSSVNMPLIIGVVAGGLVLIIGVLVAVCIARSRRRLVSGESAISAGPSHYEEIMYSGSDSAPWKRVPADQKVSSWDSSNYNIARSHTLGSWDETQYAVSRSGSGINFLSNPAYGSPSRSAHHMLQIAAYVAVDEVSDRNAHETSM